MSNLTLETDTLVCDLEEGRPLERCRDFIYEPGTDEHEEIGMD